MVGCIPIIWVRETNCFPEQKNRFPEQQESISIAV